MQNFVILSGCSGGGKSSVLEELARRGHRTVEEPGRRIVAEEAARDGAALPWVDLAAFARRACDIALRDREAAMDAPSWVFFDRGLIDAAAALEAATQEPVLAPLARTHRYHHRVFLTPPWPEIYVNDAARQHDLAAAREEYERLLRTYPALGYEVDILPFTSIAARADHILSRLID